MVTKRFKLVSCLHRPSEISQPCSGLIRGHFNSVCQLVHCFQLCRALWFCFVSVLFYIFVYVWSKSFHFPTALPVEASFSGWTASGSEEKGSCSDLSSSEETRLWETTTGYWGLAEKHTQTCQQYSHLFKQPFPLSLDRPVGEPLCFRFTRFCTFEHFLLVFWSYLGWNRVYFWSLLTSSSSISSVPPPPLPPMRLNSLMLDTSLLQHETMIFAFSPLEVCIFFFFKMWPQHDVVHVC